ncbi:MAG: class I SAM-dependent methyltransferase [Polyangiaceae bacterium]
MTQAKGAAANADMIEYWNGNGAARWLANYDAIGAQIKVLGTLALDRAAFAPESRVLDVGCGGGDSTVEIAQRLGPRGSVTGLDVSGPLLQRAIEKAFSAGVANASFTRADAQTATLPEAVFDGMFSRFGVMFFADPRAAFANIRRALRPGARMCFLCWRAMADNPMMHVPATAVSKVVEVSIAAPHAPGPFAFADCDRLRGILEGAGFTELGFEKLDEVLSVGPSPDLDATAVFLSTMGPAGAALTAAEPDVKQAGIAAIREAIEPYHTPGGLRMSSATWIVTGRA